MRIRTRILVLPVLTLGLLAACSGGSDDEGSSGKLPDPLDQTDGGGNPQPGGPVKPLTQPSRGSSVSLSEDDTRAVVVNTDVGTVSVFAIDYTKGVLPTVKKTGDVPVGAEPVQAVMHPNGTTAFVITRKDQKLVRIEDLGAVPRKSAEVSVGSEPTGIVIEPNGKMVWVTNWVDGTVMGIATDTMKVMATIDLNATLAASGLLGTGLAARPSLSHPRAIAMTNNGNDVDNDETLWVTEFYAMQKVPLDATGSNADVAKVGVVYKIPLNTKVAKVVELPPMADMGAKDINGVVAGCFPNQLSSIVIQGGFGYVPSICASPRAPGGLSLGPAFAACTTDATCPGAGAGSCVNLKCATNCTADAQCGVNGGKCNAGVCAPNQVGIRATNTTAVSIIDLGASKTIATVNLHKEFDAYYDKLGTPDDANRRLPLNPFDIGFVPGTVTAYFPSSGTDAVFRVNFDATYAAATIESIGDPKSPFINLAPAGIDPSHIGRVPTGIAVAHKTRTEGSKTRFAFVANYATRNLSVIDLANQELAGLAAGTPVTAASTEMPKDPVAAAVLDGKRMFLTGLGRWSYKGQGAMACMNCHGDGLSDNVTHQSGRGWRQIPTLEATFNKKDPTDYRVNSWSATADEVTDHEGAIRSLMGGVGLIVKNMSLELSSRLDVAGQTGLSGTSGMVADPANPAAFPVACVLDDWKILASYFKTIRSPRKASNLDAAKVAAGKALFTEGGCQGCHGGDTWTIARVFYQPEPTGTLANQLKATSWGTAATAAGFPANLFPAVTPAMQMMRYAGAVPASFDQITCAIRPVGTYGVAEPEVGVVELRSDGVTPSQGNEPDGKGFNIPSLLGMSMGAPYFHAGQARTLEAVFSEPFAGHFRAINPTFLDAADPKRAEKVSALIQYVLSIDNDAPTIPVPPLGPQGGVLCAKP
jgi:cytochrome c peroxidase